MSSGRPPIRKFMFKATCTGEEMQPLVCAFMHYLKVNAGTPLDVIIDAMPEDARKALEDIEQK